MNLDQFIRHGLSRALQAGMTSNSYVEEPGFEQLYVRFSRRAPRVALEGAPDYLWFLDIGRVEVKSPGSGAFTELLRWVGEEWPELPLFVESVLVDRFAQYLLRAGFQPDAIVKENYLRIPKVSYSRPAKARPQIRKAVPDEASANRARLRSRYPAGGGHL